MTQQTPKPFHFLWGYLPELGVGITKRTDELVHQWTLSFEPFDGWQLIE